MKPVLYLLDSDGEAHNRLWFCSEKCRAKYKTDEKTAEGFESLDMPELFCDQCGKLLKDKGTEEGPSSQSSPPSHKAFKALKAFIKDTLKSKGVPPTVSEDRCIGALKYELFNKGITEEEHEELQEFTQQEFRKLRNAKSRFKIF